MWHGLLDEVHWDDLDLFKALASAASFRQAARTMGVSVNTVRSKLARLEEALQTTLFHRNSSGLTLSEDGISGLQVAMEMQSLSSRIARGRGNNTLAKNGELQIACSEGVGEFWLTPRLAALQERVPGLIVSLHNDFDQHRIHSRSQDVSLSFVRPTSAEAIVARVGTLHFMLYASEAYLARHGVPSSLDEAKEHKLVVHDAPGLHADAMKMFIGEAAASQMTAVKVNTSYALYRAVVNGVGIGALPTYVRSISRSVRPLDLPVQLRFDLWLSYHSSFRNSTPVRHAVDWLRSCFDPVQYPWFSDDFVHPDFFQKRFEDARVYPLFDRDDPTVENDALYDALVPAAGIEPAAP